LTQTSSLKNTQDKADGLFCAGVKFQQNAGLFAKIPNLLYTFACQKSAQEKKIKKMEKFRNRRHVLCIL